MKKIEEKQMQKTLQNPRQLARWKAQHSPVEDNFPGFRLWPLSSDLGPDKASILLFQALARY